jgi:hypothetical protein
MSSPELGQEVPDDEHDYSSEGRRECDVLHRDNDNFLPSLIAFDDPRTSLG